ncbi:alpha-ketoglutarate-dependent dioxygenase AlkB [Amorphus coralli]|uniref:alpha-ketoglutarate-dependent dioxygenase AlkB n=1 Tax=Amorphus coralli TaxID=340680 RepID=UPI00037DB2C5|nr:alpha-ketoglutarate-dependent dioxygenase AlkB [Amorphus coralli]
MLPPGAVYRPDYVGVAEEAALLAQLDRADWIDELKRRVQHYGYRYDYRERRVAEGSFLGALPDWLLPIARLLVADGFFAAMPDQVIVNEYLPGQGIAPHVDCEPCFGDTIASLSLGSASLMEFRKAEQSERLDHLLEPRSLLILSGEAPYGWKHGIAARKTDVVDGVKRPLARRMSLTFRTVVIQGGR